MVVLDFFLKILQPLLVSLFASELCAYFSPALGWDEMGRDENIACE